MYRIGEWPAREHGLARGRESKVRVSKLTRAYESKPLQV
jgi:hypothetical protein